MKTIKILFILTIIILIICIFTPVKKLANEQKKCKTITDIQLIPQSNFWGKKITYILKYDNGSMYETELSTHKIGEKDCNPYNQ